MYNCMAVRSDISKYVARQIVPTIEDSFSSYLLPISIFP